MGALRPLIALNAFLQFALVGLFALVVACVGVPPRLVILALTFGLAWNSLIAGGQVALQHAVGLRAIGEFPISVARSSIIQTGDLRWLRPYGLLPHPNVLAAVLVVMLLALVYWLTTERGRVWLAALVIYVPGLWVLLLTFSRASYLGLAAGGIALLPLLFRAKRTGVYTGLSLIMTLMIGVTFFISYRPLLFARVGLDNTAAVETYSVVERDVLARTALSAVQQNLMFGVGIGNYPWWAAYTLFYADSPVRGNYGHNLLLSVWTELGIIGLALFVLTMLIGVEAVMQQIRAHPNAGDSFGRTVLLAGFIALSVIGLFDYHTYALPQLQTLWWGILACAMSAPNPPVPLATVPIPASSPDGARQSP
jgi:O-antigen ligase